MIKNLKGVQASKTAVGLYRTLQELVPNPNALLAQAGDRRVAFDNIRSDPHVASAIKQRKAGLHSQIWELQRSDSVGDIVFDTVSYVFDKLDIDNIIDNAIDGILEGYQPFEVYWQERTLKDKLLLLPSDLVAKPADWFLFDAAGRLRLRTEANYDGELTQRFKFIVAANGANYANPYGVAVLSYCLWPVLFKKQGITFWLKYIEKFGMPHYIGHTDNIKGTDDYDNFAEALDELIQDASAVIGNDDTIDILHGTTSSSNAVFTDLVNFFNAEISKAIIGQTLTTEQTSGGGTQAMAKTHFDVLRSIVESDKKVITGVFNDLIEYIVTVNFGSNIAAPLFIMYPQEDVDRALAEVTDILQKNKTLKFTKQFYINRFGFAEDEFEILEQANPIMPFAEFSDVKDFDDQVLLTDAADRAIEQGDKHISGYIQAVSDYINTSESYEDAKKNIANLLLLKDNDAFEQDMLNKVFNAEMLGRFAAKEEQGDG